MHSEICKQPVTFKVTPSLDSIPNFKMRHSLPHLFLFVDLQRFTPADAGLPPPAGHHSRVTRHPAPRGGNTLSGVPERADGSRQQRVHWGFEYMTTTIYCSCGLHHWSSKLPCTHIPPTSSGLVSVRNSSTFSPFSCQDSATSAENTMRPTAAPTGRCGRCGQRHE